nr:hypothetical protein [uncultured Bacteroides sp.]
MTRKKGSQRAMLNLIESETFLTSINNIIKPNAEISMSDNWAPENSHNCKEAELKGFLIDNFFQELGDDIHDWWLAVKRFKASTPNWDLVSTCTVDGKKGILLIEAKAHKNELKRESYKKRLDPDATDDSKRNDRRIGEAIQEANTGIRNSDFDVSISKDRCYQLSNRVAHAWWLANQGIPVVLLYLGFLDCQDMNDGKCKLLNSSKDWEDCFLNHAKQVGVDTIMDKWVDCGNSRFKLICRVYRNN